MSDQADDEDAMISVTDYQTHNKSSKYRIH